MTANQLQGLLPLVLIAVVCYLLLIRPARARARATATLQSALSPGDEVMLSSGFFATVLSVADEVATVELAPGTVVRVHRGAVTQIVVDRPADDEGDDESERGRLADGDSTRAIRETPLSDNPGVN